MLKDENHDADPRVERSEDGDLMVRADGRLYPAVEQTPTGDGVTGVSRCPYSCQAETHIHSVEPGLMGHRTSHCYPEKAEDDVGYFLLRAWEGLLGLPYRWWEKTVRELETDGGFGLNVNGRGPGLLEVI